MSKSQTPAASGVRTPRDEWLSFRQIEQEYGSPTEQTCFVWSSQNRYGFRDLVRKFGRLSRVRRSSFESWIESRRAG